jgi:biotin synthase-like enzyme
VTFEIGPIRPPSEARSLLVRVTRNCPHNRCAFCPVYRGTRFSIRTAEEVIADIEAMGRVAARLRERSFSLGLAGAVTLEVLRRAAAAGELGGERTPCSRGGVVFGGGGAQVATFLASGGAHAFLQDANSLVMRPEELLRVLDALRETFPSIDRVTSYARAHTLTRRKPEHLAALRARGLDRVHVGLESGSDRVLELVQKGVDAARHVEAGRRARQAGMELSEYVMPGLGGRRLSREHALESARVLSEIDPDFIRLRTTAVVPGTALERLTVDGRIEPMDDEAVVAEIRLLIENLDCTSTLQSDHVLNLLGELEGRLPEDRGRLLAIIDRFQGLPPELRRAFVLARRAGVIARLDDLDRPGVRERALELLAAVVAEYDGDLDAAVRELMTRFI